MKKSMKLKMFLIDKYEKVVFGLLKKINSQKVKSQMVRLIPFKGDDYRYLERSLSYLNQICEANKEHSQLIYPEYLKSELIKPEKIVKKLKRYDVVSFDIFDTLIFRCWYGPSDIFEVMGILLKIPNFKEIRKNAEKIARKNIQHPIHEVKAEDIYKMVEVMCGVNWKTALELEFELQKKYTFANPYMKKVFDLLLENNVRVVITSDMYFCEEKITELLNNSGYCGYEKIFVSADYDCCKVDGRLQKYISENHLKDQSVIHVGDNNKSDIDMSKKNGWETWLYEPVNSKKRGGAYRATQMSSLGGALYRGLVNANNWSGIPQKNKYHEFGYTYIGIVIYSFCAWINELVKKEGFDQVLFCARDMKIVHQIYSEFFNAQNNEYINISRIIAYKLDFEHNISGMIWYIKKNIIDSGEKCISEILSDVELDMLVSYLSVYNIDANMKAKEVDFSFIEKMIYEHKSDVIEKFSEEKELLINYYKDIIGKNKKILVVDTNGRLTSFSALRNIISKYINEDIDVKAALLYSVSDPGYVDANILTENVYVMLFSYLHNKDSYYLYRFIGEERTKFIEAIFTSEAGTCRGIDPITKEFSYYKNNDNLFEEITGKIHSGVRDFCKQYDNVCEVRGIKIVPSSYDAWRPLEYVIDDSNVMEEYFDDLCVDLYLGENSNK